MTTPKEKPSPAARVDETALRELVLFNDDVNTFDFVIDTLIDVCEHQPEQAEQCAMIAHYKGRCVVRTGDLTTLKPMRNEMTNRGLTVTIE